MSEEEIDFLDSLEPDPAPTPKVPVAPHEAPVVPSDAWVIPKPKIGMPSRRTLFEVALVAALAWSLFGRGVHLPTPVPPGPTPNTSPLVAALVYDVETDGFATAVLRSDATLAPTLKGLNTKWEVVDKGDPKAPGYLKGNPTPALTILEQGKPDPISVTKAPPTSADVVTAIKTIREGK